VEIAEAFRRAGVNLVTDDGGLVAVREDVASSCPGIRLELNC